ncbi:Fe(3+) dicitrate transport system permease protein FecD [Psychrobacter sp. SC65A.3]|uniref:FecCD family ABC transporter permease n=1 Tax=Psychrobacter sp. SC65A.3 TaxID=2983299 RepID=UPI0021D846A1|nr:iron chelate uptake ABC transporter family permease subunit [Psychrobacter sp. SC65A.3]WAI87815.1 Fe(3+) dicitrate transport system permease protein FecD [Psychrobacter sp. SC65A.3]
MTIQTNASSSSLHSLFARKSVGRAVRLIILLLFILSISSIFFGASELTLAQIWQHLQQGFGGDKDFIVWQHRLPRTLLSILVGASLGLSGSLVQGVIRNPLASPDLMGISAGAGFCATLLLVMLPAAPTWWLSVAALLGGLLAFSFIMLLAQISQPTPARLALIGVAISAFLASGINFLLVIYPVEINTAMIWLTGSLWGRSWQHIPMLTIIFAVLMAVSMYLAWRLDVLGLGEETAYHLGVSVKPLEFTTLVIAVVIASLAVSVAGTVSFIGLLAPHIARLLFGHQHRILLPASALIGAIILVTADVLARSLFAPIELPAGVLTSVIGAPYFIFLLSRYKGW